MRLQYLPRDEDHDHDHQRRVELVPVLHEYGARVNVALHVDTRRGQSVSRTVN